MLWYKISSQAGRERDQSGGLVRREIPLFFGKLSDSAVFQFTSLVIPFNASENIKHHFGKKLKILNVRLYFFGKRYICKYFKWAYDH